MSRTPVFVKAFNRIINITEIRAVTPVAPPLDGYTPYLHIDFIEAGFLDLEGVDLDEFFEVLADARSSMKVTKEERND
ncbi:hypothetical protein SEA_PUREGLOBE5_74 [Arthrobacter phage Pureglobe5]|nr:hypothetical protein PBI_BEAGLE_76 [Arthrobacter phage Beagle]QOP66825.1 hypothetical protein SEA_ODYSSEY395_76 [Arthrobacter phage Odyssey395]UYL87437.1 hypothetical protein SEA_PUREGLOBE5_74 [Arthrobacter phage Pureglobe5]